MSSLNLSMRKREPSRGSLKLDEEKSIFGKIYSSVKEKRTIDPTPSLLKLEDMITKEKEKEREKEREKEKEKEKEKDIFGKIYASVREKKKSLDLTPSLHKLEEMLAREKEKDADKEKNKEKDTDSEKTRKKKKKQDNTSEGTTGLNVSALKKLDEMYNKEDNRPATSSSSSSSSSFLLASSSTNPTVSPSNDTSNPRTLQRKDSLRSLPTYHHTKKQPIKNKETSLFSMKRDMSVMEVGSSADKRVSSSSISFSPSLSSSVSSSLSSRRGGGDINNTRGKRAMSSPKRGGGVEETRRNMEKLTRFEHTRKVNMEKIQSKLNVPAAPIIVSSRLPTTLLPPLTLSRPTKRKAETWSNTRSTSPVLLPRSPPLSPRSEKKPSSSTSSMLVSSPTVNITSNGSINNNITFKHDDNNSADVTLMSSSSSSNGADINKSPNTEVLISCSVMIDNDNNTDIFITPPDNESKWFTGLSTTDTNVNNQAVSTINRQRANSYDSRGLISRELSVAGHRITKDDVYI